MSLIRRGIEHSSSGSKRICIYSSNKQSIDVKDIPYTNTPQPKTTDASNERTSTPVVVVVVVVVVPLKKKTPVKNKTFSYL